MAEDTGKPISLELDRGVWWLTVLGGVVLAANAAVHIVAVKVGTSDPSFRVLRRLLSVDEEAAVPAYFSTLILLLASGLLWAMAKVERADGGRAWPWLVLSAGFLYMSLDENVALHEHWGRLIASMGVERSGYLYWQWVLPALAVVSVVGIALARFWWQLPPATRFGFAAAGGLYLTGAIGFEMLSGPVAEVEGLKSVRYLVLTSTEEALEIIGIVAFLSVLARHLQARAVLGVMPRPVHAFPLAAAAAPVAAVPAVLSAQRQG